MNTPPEGGPAWVVWLAMTAAAIVVVALLASVVAMAAGSLALIATEAAGAASPLADVVGRWGPVRVITTPVVTYLHTHAAALPVTPDVLWQVWAWTGLGLLVLAWSGSRGARAGWVLIGAATAAMVHAATPTPGAWLATGVTAVAWGVLCIPAFAGAGRRAPVIIEHPEPRDELD